MIKRREINVRKIWEGEAVAEWERERKREREGVR